MAVAVGQHGSAGRQTKVKIKKTKESRLSVAATILKRTFQSFGSDKCATLSAAIAYYTVFALFPMALVGVSLLGFFVEEDAARQQVIQGLSSVLSLGDAGEAALAQTLEGVSQQKGVLGLIGLATAIWSASGLFGSIRSALNSVWDVDMQRPMLRAKATDLLLFVGFGGLLMSSTAVTGMVQTARATDLGQFGFLMNVAEPIFWLIAIAGPLILTFAAFMFLYRFAPHARLRWRDVFPAAVIAALFFEFGKAGLTYYIRNLGDFNALAGSLGAAILFLVFVYYASQVILFAAELSKHLLLVREGALPGTDPKVEGPKRSLPEKIKRMVLGLWRIEEHHHDSDLPYKPGRIDPHGHRPTDTREEVLVKQEEAIEKAGEAANPSPEERRRDFVAGLAGSAKATGRTGANAVTSVVPPKPAHQSSGPVRHIPMRVVGLVALVVAVVLSRFGR